MTSVMCMRAMHRHEPVKTGARCAFPAEGRPGGICGRTPVAVYVNPDAKVLRTYRCRAHDRDVAVAEAARLGFVRQAVR